MKELMKLMEEETIKLIDEHSSYCTYHVKDDGNEMLYGMRVLSELKEEIINLYKKFNEDDGLLFGGGDRKSIKLTK